ncbi:MAG: UbiA family prenyltransferase [Candidatus Micrarchaeota archaeon]
MNVLSLARLTRIEHSIFLVIAVAIGEIMALGHFPNPELAVMSFIPPFAIGLASFAINDYFDLETDKQNRRTDRPLVNGSVTPHVAFYGSMVLFLLGISASFWLSPDCQAIASAFAIAAFLYSYKLKDMPLVGNAYIASTMAIPFIYGSYVIDPNIKPAIIVLSIIAFITGLAREIAGDVRDMEGDIKARNSKTIPLLIGKRNAITLQCILYLIAVLLSVYPYLYIEPFIGNINYIIPIIVTDILIAYAAISTVFDQSAKSFRKARNMSLAALGIGLIGFLSGIL